MYYDLFFSIILSFALLAALFFCTSCRVGLITCFVSIVYWLSFARFLKWYFIIRSSILWNEIIAQRPPGASTVSNWLMKSSTCQNSLFVTILIHWKIGASSFFEILNSWRSFVNHVVAVSYTHLDVYKRQTQEREITHTSQSVIITNQSHNISVSESDFKLIQWFLKIISSRSTSNTNATFLEAVISVLEDNLSGSEYWKEKLVMYMIDWKLDLQKIKKTFEYKIYTESNIYKFIRSCLLYTSRCV